MKPGHRCLLLTSWLLCLAAPAAAQSLGELTTVDRPWLTEDEFLAEESLLATRGQIIVLHLEGAETGRAGIHRNSVRFLVEEPRHYGICIPGNEPYIQRIKLRRIGGPTLVNGAHGSGCRTVLLEPGRYDLEIFHDSRSVPTEGRKAFVYRSSQSPLGGSLTGPNLPQFDFMAFGAFDKFVSSATPAPAMQLAAVAENVGPEEVWRVTPVSDSKFALTSGTGAGVVICRDGDGALLTAGADVACDTDIDVLRATFRRENVSGVNFGLQLAVAQNGYVYNYPVFVNTSDGNYLFGGGGILTDFNSAYYGYDCATTCTDATLPLSPGTIALYSQCNYQGNAIVFQADTPDLAIYNSAGAAGLAMGSNQARSIRVAPGTVVTLYPEANYGGAALTAGANIPCLDDTALGNDTLASFKIIDQSPINYIVSSNGCRDCILTGIDFSSQDFDGFDFAGTSFAGADLTSTTLRDATLTGVDFSGAGSVLAGTDFTGANLACASFWNADVSSAIFADLVLSAATPCLLDMEAATLDFGTFPPQYWRNTNLTASNMVDLPDVLSSTGAPLDLSGTNLSQVQWLAGRTLDGVNLGCYPRQPGQTTVCPDPSGPAACSTLQGTVLTGTSLRKACLSNASMEGAFLSFSNLDGADLSGSELQQALTGGKVTTLEGAFMRNVNLSGANLTGVNAKNVNFYTASGGAATAWNLTAPSANFTGAYLAFADFSGSQSNLQSTIWSDAMLLGADFEQADLSINTSGGVNSGTNTTFSGAYLQGASFASAVLDDVDFTNTYWDAIGAGGKLNFLIPKSNLQFSGYWKDLALPECPPYLMWASGLLPPRNTTSDNTCPSGDPGPCDSVWDQPKVSIDSAYFQSAVWPDYPQDTSVSSEDQCSSSFSDPNPYDLCWTITDPPTGECVAN